MKAYFLAHNLSIQAVNVEAIDHESVTLGRKKQSRFTSTGVYFVTAKGATNALKTLFDD